MGRTAERDSVLANLDTALHGDDLAARALIGLAAKRLESDPDGARELLTRIVSNYPSTPEAGDARLQLGSLLFQGGRVEEAYEMVLPLCGDADLDLAGRACMRAAESKYEAGDLETAAEFYSKALGTNSDSVDRGAALYGLAWCEMEIGKTQEAMDAFFALYGEHKGSPLWTDGAYRLGQLLLNEGRKQEAADVFKALGDVDQTGSLGLEASYKRALILRDRKAYSQAAALLRKVAKSAEGQLGELSLFELGRTLHRQNRLTEATKVFLELAEDYPESELAQQAVYSAGVCQTSMKRWGKGADFFARASGMDGSMRPDALLGEGWARAKTKEHQRAAYVFEVLLQDFPDYVKGPEVSFRLAQSLAELGHYAKVDSICSGLAIRPDWQYPDRALYLQGIAREDMGDNSGAAEVFQQLIENYRNSDLAPHARDHLDALAGGGE